MLTGLQLLHRQSYLRSMMPIVYLEEVRAGNL